MKSRLLTLALLCCSLASAQSFVEQHPCGLSAPPAAWSPDCQYYFENVHGRMLDSAMDPPWSIFLMKVGHGSPWLASDPSLNVHSDLKKHFPGCLKFEISAVRWITSQRLLISAQPTFCSTTGLAPLLYTVNVTNNEIVRGPGIVLAEKQKAEALAPAP
jgi:hypothetical protein